jgi:hypothetical protein
MAEETAEKTELTYEEALALKEDLAGRPAPPAGVGWRVTQMPDARAAAAFLNRPPRQGAGEASMTNRPDGQVDVYFFTRI